MKKYLLIFSLFFCSFTVRAQSVTLYDLINLSNIGSRQAYNYMMGGKLFKRVLIEQVNGLSIEHYRAGAAPKTEEVIIGNGIKTSDSFLRKVTYTTTQPKYLLKMVNQAKGAGLSVNFEGSDGTKNIYMFDNFLYTVHIYINNDLRSGSVEVQQKELENHD